MGTAAILPVKRFDAAKQRLGDALGARTRATLAAAMCADVLAQLRRARAIDQIVVVSGEPVVHELVRGSAVTLIDDPADKGQSHAARTGLARAAALGCPRALLVPADCPLLDPSEVDALVATAAGFDVVIVPDRHGTGTNALVVDPAGPFAPRFGPGSHAQHVEQAQHLDLTYTLERVPSLALDLDTRLDLLELVATLERSHGLASRTRGIVNQIKRAGSVAA